MKYIAGLLLTSIVSLTTFAQVKQQGKEAIRYIRVMGHAEQYYEPTFVNIYLSLSEKEKVNDNNYVAEKEKDLLSVLQEFGIDQSKLRVQQFNTGEAYSFLGSKYQVNKNYMLRIEKLDKYESIIVRLAEKGFKNIYVGDYGIHDKAKRMDELLAEAVKNGASKANIIAGAANVKNIHLVSVDETNDNTPIPYMTKSFAARNTGAMDAADQSVNMQLGRIFMQKDLTLVYEIE
jgi:uncharacterized protein YggE